MQGKPIYAYDPQSGEYVKEWPSKNLAEQELSIYRGSIHDFIRTHRKTPVGGFFWSLEKMDKYPMNGTSTPKVQPKTKNGQSGISLSDFRNTNDVSMKVQQAMEKLRKDRLYTLDDMYELIGLRKGFSQLRQTIDSYKENYGKGVADGKLYFGHQDIIAELKREKSMA